MAKLTSVSIEKTKAGLQRREISDGSGLWLVIQPSGSKSFAARFRVNRVPKKLTLGTWPEMSLKAARAAAATAIKQVEDGTDPTAAKKVERAKQQEADANTFAAISAEYLKREGPKLRSIKRREADLKRLVYPRLGNKPIEKIERIDVVRLLDKIEDEISPVMADQALKLLRRVFNWHASRSNAFRSPLVAGMARTSPKERERTRILNDAELRQVWLAAEKDATPFSRFTRYLLLSACRKSEAVYLTWDEIDSDGVWTLPAARAKGKTEIVRPLSQAALKLLADIPRVEGCRYVFSNDGRRPLGSGAYKVRFDEATGVTGYVLHDLRRSARSLMSRAGVPSDVAEMTLGHRLGGVRGIYDRHSFLSEKKLAYERLAALIESIVRPKANVIPLRG